MLVQEPLYRTIDISNLLIAAKTAYIIYPENAENQFSLHVLYIDLCMKKSASYTNI